MTDSETRKLLGLVVEALRYLLARQEPTASVEHAVLVRLLESAMAEIDAECQVGV